MTDTTTAAAKETPDQKPESKDPAEAQVHAKIDGDEKVSDLDNHVFALDFMEGEGSTDAPKTPEGKKADAKPEGDGDKPDPSSATPEEKTVDNDDLTPDSKVVAKATEGIRNDLVSERRERQRLENEVAELRGFVKGKTPEADTVDEELAHYDDPIGSIDKRVNAALDARESRQLQREVLQSKSRAMEKHKDFAEMEDIFVGLAEKEPSLVDRMHAHHDPAEFAYNFAKTHKRFNGASSVDDFEKAVEKRVRADVEKELRDKAAADAAAGVVPSNAGAQGTGASMEPDLEKGFTNPELDF